MALFSEHNQSITQAWQYLKTSNKGGGIIFSIGLVLFLASCWLFLSQQKSNLVDLSKYKVERTAPAFPDDAMLNNLTTLYGNQQAQNSGKERFRVTEQIASDDILMDAPKASIQGKIVGIVTSNNSDFNTVIIDASGKQQTYSKGDRISNSYPVIKIFPDRVIIDEDGFYAALTLEE